MECLIKVYPHLIPSLSVIPPYCPLSMLSTRLKPYPGPGSAVDIAIILNALEFHKKQFPYKGEENNKKVLKQNDQS